MSNTAPTIRNNWNKKNYDRIGITVPKGMREMVRRHAEKQGMTVNQLINVLVRDEIGILQIEWGFAVGENQYLNKKTA